MGPDELYERRERLADDVRQYVIENTGTTTAASGYHELTEEVYLDPGQGKLVDAGSVEVETDGSPEQTAVEYLQQEGAVSEYKLREEMNDAMHMDLDIDRALSALEDKDNIRYSAGTYRLDTRPKPASDGQVLELLETGALEELDERVLEP